MTNHRTTDIQKLLKRCFRGNRKAQEHLHRLYYGYAMSIALRYSKSYDDAEEVCNDAFYKLFTKTEKKTRIENFNSWFRKIVVNTAIDHFRSHERNNRLVLLDEYQEIANDDVNLAAIDAEEIISLLQSLSPMYRLVFNLSVMEGYHHEEIANKLNITAATSRSNLARAKQKLRVLINEGYYEQAK